MDLMLILGLMLQFYYLYIVKFEFIEPSDHSFVVLFVFFAYFRSVLSDSAVVTIPYIH